MLLQADIRANLIDRLAPIFGKPRDPDFLAAELVKHVPQGVTDSDMHALADRLIATRKTKGFPPASDLIAAVRSLTRAVARSGGIQGEITADGEIPMTWILASDPRWPELCAIAKAREPRYKPEWKPKPYAATSKYAPGVGRWFRSEHVRGVPVTDDERTAITALYTALRQSSGWSEKNVA